MTDLTHRFLPALKSHRLPGLTLEGDFLYPRYADQSVLNLPSTICHILGAPPLGAGALHPDILAHLGSARRVILILMDALALHRLQRWMRNGVAPQWAEWVDAGSLFPLTSIVPSTTSAALTSLWTGRSVAEHGVAGYELWLKEYGVIANMILHGPMYFQNDVGTLSRAGFKPEAFLQPFTTLGTHLLQHGVKTYVFQHRSIIRSGLSQMFFQDVNLQAVNTAADLWVNVRLMLENRPRERQYTWVYWSEVDHFSHFYGPDDERPAAEFAAFTRALDQHLLQRLAPEARKDTLILLTADHGALSTPRNPELELSRHGDFTRRLHLLPTGENRLPYLHVRPGQEEALHKYIQSTWPGQFTLVNAVVALEQGLFGPGQPHPALADRLGDWIAIPHGNAYWWWAEKENQLVGRHGGLHPDEMLVPLAAFRL